AWLNRHYGGVDLAERFPLMKELGRLGWKPITTLYNITSKHADAHSQFYRPQYDKRWGNPAPEPAKPPYERYEASLFFPFYGMSVLRGGAPGRRTELIVNHQNAWQHSHYDRLGYQLFHEGVECLPDFGYCVGSIDPGKAPWKDLKLGYELLGLPPTAGQERHSPWRRSYSAQPEGHNVAMVDHWLHVDSAFCRVYGFSGAAGMSDPGWWAQFLDVDGASLFAGRPNKVDTYRRQLAMVTLPGGSALVLDIFRIAGGARHDLFVHVPADTPAPLAGRGEPIGSNWSDYLGLERDRDKLTGANLTWYGAAGKLITGLRRHRMPEGTWCSEWHIQPSRAIPQGQADRRHYEQWPELLHDVRLAAWSYAGGGAGHSELISARGPWPGSMTINDLKTGRAKTDGTVGLKDALDFRIFTRTAPAPGLESVFVQAIEGRTPELPAELTDFKVAASAPLAAGGGVLCELKTAAGPGVCASTLNGEPFEAGGVTLSGRLGIALPPAGRLALYDGTRFNALGWGVALEPGCEATLAGVVGDLTGRPKESALLVRSARPLPTDGTLSNRQVYVWHQFAGQQSVYTIARVTAGPAGLWRLDLAGHPPFISQRAYVLKIDPAKPRKMQRDSQFSLFIHKTNVAGRRIRFPRTGYETAMVSCDRSNFSVESDPPPGKVAKGDPFVVYSVQPGDRVTIPNFFACTGLPAGEGERKLSLESSCDARLGLPGAWRCAALETPDGRRVELRTARAGAGTAIELEHRLLADGRGTLVLAR
ncbi:MAG: heparinase II/III family protein, partial [Kiritimatiellae bacterium]|nr:heparinase II/III family protein [Kiritimatiellia bacterium]